MTSEGKQQQTQVLKQELGDKNIDQPQYVSVSTSVCDLNDSTVGAQDIQPKRDVDEELKKITFYCSGDDSHKGLVYTLSSEKIKSFNDLLEDLTGLLGNHNKFPKGVYNIFTINGKEKITNLDKFQRGESYLCSSAEDIGKCNSVIDNKIEKSQARPQKQTEISISAKSTLPPSRPESRTRDNRAFIHPKLITVIRSGVKPRKSIRMLLNKKTAHSFEQVLRDMTSVIRLDTGAVRKIFTLSGKQVVRLEDFFGDEEVFIAYGTEKFLSEDFDLDPEEWKIITRGSSGTRRSKHAIGEQTTPAKQSPESSAHSSLTASPKATRHIISSKSKQENGHVKWVSMTPLPKEITDHYEIGKVIGDGNFAVVRECTDKVTKLEYALKIINKKKCKGKEHMITSEVAILRIVKHPNIIQLLGEFDFGDELYLVMELVKGGDLFDSISTSTKYTERDASGMVYNLCSALRYLHSLNIVHRDIKPENLLVMEHEDGSKSLKLGDFGLATEVTEPLHTVCGTPTYVAPEILVEAGYGLKVDVWAAGVITYILLCGFPPFVSETNNQDELFDQILAGKYEFNSPFWDDVSNSAKELITQMLQLNPTRRYSAAQVLKHPWVAEDAMAPDYDMHSAISRKLNVHFDHKRKYSLQSAGVALVAATPLDKEQNYFQAHSRSSQASPRPISPVVLQQLLLDEENF